MSDGSGGIRAVMISTAHHDLLLNLRDRLRLPTTAKTLEKLIADAHAQGVQVPNKGDDRG